MKVPSGSRTSSYHTVALNFFTEPQEMASPQPLSLLAFQTREPQSHSSSQQLVKSLEASPQSHSSETATGNLIQTHSYSNSTTKSSCQQSMDTLFSLTLTESFPLVMVLIFISRTRPTQPQIVTQTQVLVTSHHQVLVRAQLQLFSTSISLHPINISHQLKSRPTWYTHSPKVPCEQ